MEKGYLGIRKEITFLIKYAVRSHRIYKENSLAGVMVNVLVSSAIDRGVHFKMLHCKADSSFFNCFI
jgi:hypothetical protein